MDKDNPSSNVELLRPTARCSKNIIRMNYNKSPLTFIFYNILFIALWAIVGWMLVVFLEFFGVGWYWRYPIAVIIPVSLFGIQLNSMLCEKSE